MDGIEGKLEAESPSRKLLPHQSGTETDGPEGPRAKVMGSERREQVQDIVRVVLIRHENGGNEKRSRGSSIRICPGRLAGGCCSNHNGRR